MDTTEMLAKAFAWTCFILAAMLAFGLVLVVLAALMDGR